MKILRKITCLIIFLITLNLGCGYCYFDNLSGARNSQISIGEWNYVKNYFADFENFNSPNYFLYNANINGLSWELYQAESGNSLFELKKGNKSLRIYDNGYMASNVYFVGLKSISFYLGTTHYDFGDNNSRRYKVQISADGTNWTNVKNGKVNRNSFEFIQVDMQTLLAKGIRLSNNVTATLSTPLQIRIYIENPNSSPIFSERYSNLDNLTITYLSTNQ